MFSIPSSLEGVSPRSSALGIALLILAAGCVPEPPPTDAPEAPEFPQTNRPDVRGTEAAVVSGHPLATAVGHQVLRDGGNAVDAAVAMAGVLAVVRPHMNGVGGDAFALFYDGATGEVTGLNGSGGAGSEATADFFRNQDLEEVPETGPLSVSVPGAVAAWTDALDRFGTRSLEELLQPAVRYAREGFPVTTRLGADFEAQGGELNDAGRALYLPDGTPPAAGTLLRNPALAETLERIARDGADGFYRGPVAERIVSFVEERGGTLRPGDLTAHTSTWTEPLEADYLGHRIHVLPPNTQGFAQLQQMVMAREFDLEEMGHNSTDYLHTLVELKKLAFADRDRWAVDPEFVDIPLDRLLDEGYLRDRATGVRMDEARESVEPGVTGSGTVAGGGLADRNDSGDTVYLMVVDRWGNGVSWIQSLFHGFGSGLLDPDTGILLHNRGSLFSLEEGHPNRVEPGKRPYHTLTPLLGLTPEGDLAFTLGTPGGDAQTQILLQIANAHLLFGMTPQEALEAPRYRSGEGRTLLLEDRIPPSVWEELRARRHEVEVIHGWTRTFGGAQMIRVDPGSGTLTAAADPRREGYAIAY